MFESGSISRGSRFEPSFINSTRPQRNTFGPPDVKSTLESAVVNLQEGNEQAALNRLRDLTEYNWKSMSDRVEFRQTLREQESTLNEVYRLLSPYLVDITNPRDAALVVRSFQLLTNSSFYL